MVDRDGNNMFALDTEDRYRRHSGAAAAAKEGDDWATRAPVRPATASGASAGGLSADMLQARAAAYDASVLFMPVPAPMLPPQRRQPHWYHKESSGKVRTGSGKVRSNSSSNTKKTSSGKIRKEGSFDSSGKKVRNGSARNGSSKRSGSSAGSGAARRPGSRSTARGLSAAAGTAGPGASAAVAFNASDVVFSSSHKNAQKAKKSGRRSAGRSRTARGRQQEAAAAQKFGPIMASSVERGRKEERARAWEADVAWRSALPARLERLAEAATVENVGDGECEWGALSIGGGVTFAEASFTAFRRE